MGTVTISTMTPQRRELRSLDPTGETWVKIRPPGYEEEMERGQLTSKRSYSYGDDGRMVTHVDVNTRLLWAEEIWLTYEGACIDVAVQRGDEEEHIVIDQPRGQITRAEFMGRLSKLPPQVVYEWHAMVVDVVREWATPF